MSDDALELFDAAEDATEGTVTPTTRGTAGLGILGLCLAFGLLVGIGVGAVIALWYLLYGSASFDVIAYGIFQLFP
ncbi:hypothetical protein HII28_12080 [Planctomonas sp. JC2975]|uniref:hypothetical protein n=1 Tax=Planctomonas sp. JC2975 TaxID=2729626 RepID=UPI0014752164|nr:hypothetical protein [Planctomonas sp. JC2975]NNC12612.1 hypothetical protein [Planctomonas sp. JC2975]